MFLTGQSANHMQKTFRNRTHSICESCLLQVKTCTSVLQTYNTTSKSFLKENFHMCHRLHIRKQKCLPYFEWAFRTVRCWDNRANRFTSTHHRLTSHLPIILFHKHHIYPLMPSLWQEVCRWRHQWIDVHIETTGVECWCYTLPGA